MALAPRSHPFVGRSPDLSRLRSMTGLAGEGDTAGVLVSGDAGIGKSRLVAEVAAEATDAGHQVVVGHCVGVGGSTVAWLPFVEVVTELGEVLPDVVATTLTTHPALRALLPGDGPGTTDDPARVAAAAHALLTEAARERPLLVVVEDVHWADHSSRDLLTLLLTRGFTTPGTLVVTYRSDDVHRRHPLHEVLAVWTRLPIGRIDLGPLPTSDMRALVRDLESAPDGDRLGEIVARAGGNPFFAEELVASGDTTSADLARLLRLRLDHLDEPGRQVVRAASLAGGPVDPELLAVVVGMDPDDLDGALHEAIDHHILQVRGDGSLGFRHSLLGETVAEELLPGARRRLHTAWIDALRARPDLGSPADLARHAAATGDTGTAITAAVAAGDAALRVGGARDAQRLYEAALRWISDDPARRGEVAVVAARAAERAGDTVRSIDLLEEVLPELDPDAHPLVRARVLARLAAKYTFLDLPSDPVAMATQAMALLPGPVDEHTLIIALDHLDVLVGCGDPRASAVADALLLDTERLGLPRAAARVRMQQTRLLSSSDPDRAHAELSTAVADADAGPELVLPALLRLGNLDRGAGRMAAALEHYLRGVEVADRSLRPWGPFGLECRLQGGRTAYELGRWGEAERLLTTPADLPQPPHGFMTGALVELLVARGEPDLEHLLDDTRGWWDVDALLIVGTLGGMIDVLGRAGMVEQLLEWSVAGVEGIQRAWGEDAQSIIRIGALLAGQTADLARDPSTPEDLLAGLRRTVGRLAEQSRTIVERAKGDDPAAAGREAVGPESLAWAARFEAEVGRDPGAGTSVDADEQVGRWRRSVEAFAELANQPELARSQLHLAEALAAAGRAEEAAQVAAEAREIATGLGARPVLDALDRLDTSGGSGTSGESGQAQAGAPEPATVLTPREGEVLALLDRGMTNGDIATELYISRKTASVHVSNILAKLGARTRGEAVSIARERGLLG